MKKEIVFRIIMVLLILVCVESALRLVDFTKHKVLKKTGIEWKYTEIEKKLMDMHKERKKDAQAFGEFVYFSPEFYILEETKCYKPRPNSRVVLIMNERVEPMSMVLNDELEGLLEHFEGEKYSTNYDHLGLRKTGKTIIASDEDKKMSILMLGDSFTNGCYVNDEDTFSAHVEKYAERDGLDIHVLNTGLGGYSTKEEYYRFVDMLPYIDLDMVILNFFPNDTGVVEHKVVGYWMAKDPQTKAGLWFFRHVLMAKELMKGYYSLFSKPQDPRKNKKVQIGWQTSFHYLTKIKEVCDREKLPFIIVAIPPKEQFEFGNKEFYQEKLKKFCKEKNIIFLDPYEYLEDRNPSTLYLNWDPHFTKEGNSVYGNFIYTQTRSYLTKSVAQHFK